MEANSFALRPVMSNEGWYPVGKFFVDLKVVASAKQLILLQAQQSGWRVGIVHISSYLEYLIHLASTSMIS